MPSIGWCWVPGERSRRWRWRPAHVRFVTGPAWVAWVPLGPGEAYYWRHTPSAHLSVSINVNVTNAVTIIHHDTFVRGARVAAPLPPNPFKVGKIIAGPPLIVPTRASLAPLPTKVVPRYAVPPTRIVHKPVVVKTPAPPAPRLFSDKIKDIKATHGMPVKPVTAVPKTEPAKRGVVKTMPIKPIKAPKEAKTPAVEKRERPEFKKDAGKAQIPERKTPAPQKKIENKRPKIEPRKMGSITEPKKQKIEKKESPVKKKLRIDDDEIKKQPKDIKRKQRGKERGHR